MTPGGGHVVLVGMMGAGKTTVGHLLAERWGVALVDSDERIEQATGLTVRELFARDGEAAFRRLESEALGAALDDPEASVVAAAGGVVLDPANRERLRADPARVVWLRVSPEVLAERAIADPDGHRPLLDGDAAATLSRLATERADLYAAVADVIVDIGSLDPAGVADAIAGALET